MPSFTFPSTANCVVLRGATPVFVDSDEGTMNIDPVRVRAAVTSRTAAVIPVHYAGTGCDMDAICGIARDAGAMVIEDAAQAVCASWQGRSLGAIGQLGALSFHVSKNVSCGEGGALLINEPRLVERAEILWEKGTDRKRFLRGEVAKYRWRDVGSSFLPSEVLAALLSAQMERAWDITRARVGLWDRYHGSLAPLEDAGFLRRPTVPAGCHHNGHIYFITLRSTAVREMVVEEMRRASIMVQTHYVPLHSAPAGRRFGRAHGPMDVVDSVAPRLLRLPLFPDMTPEQHAVVVGVLQRVAGMGG